MNILDSENKVVSEWISEDKIHEIELNEGEYKLKEIKAPEGYWLNTEEIRFKVDQYGDILEQDDNTIIFSNKKATTGKLILRSRVEGEEIDKNTTFLITDIKNKTTKKVLLSEFKHKDKVYEKEIEYNAGRYNIKVDSSTNGITYSVNNGPKIEGNELSFDIELGKETEIEYILTYGEDEEIKTGDTINYLLLNGIIIIISFIGIVTVSKRMRY